MIGQKKFPAWYRQARLLLGGLVLTVLSLPIRADFFTISTGEAPPPPLPFSSVLPKYAVVSVGSSARMDQNSGPISGSVLIGIGSVTTSSGGDGGAITGGVDNSGPPLATGSLFGSPQSPPMGTNVAASVGQTADAAALSAVASALTWTVPPLGNISGARTFAGNGDLNVIRGAWSSPVVTLTGGPNDFFNFNFTSFVTANTAMNIGGVDPSHILSNLTAAWGSRITDFVPFAPPDFIDNGAGAAPLAVPDGGMTIMLLGGALVGLESLRRRLRVVIIFSSPNPDPRG